MKKISEKTALYDLRQKRGMTQRQIAEAIGASVQQVCALENGTRKLAPEWIDRLSKVLKCSKAELFGEDAPEPLTNREKAFLEMFRNLSEREQDGIMAAFNVLAKPAPDKKAGSE